LSSFFIFIFYAIPILKKETRKVIVVGGLIIASFLLAVVVTRVSTPAGGSEALLEEFQEEITDAELDELNNSKKPRKTYIETLLDGSAFKTYSMTGRLDIWSHMWSMIKKKPVFG